MEFTDGHIILRPYTLDDVDAARAIRYSGAEAVALWHGDPDLKDVDAVVLPGGFSYGDYLRCGAIAKFSPVMAAVKRFAAEGGLVLGVCNGFQVLTEAGLLPGALVRNANLKFVCRQVIVEVATTNSPFTHEAKKGQRLTIPIAHGEGCYVAQERVLDELEDTDRVVLRYIDNPNGSLRNIAGVLNEQRNVMGMMPHPERVADPLMGGTDGLSILQSLAHAGVVSSRS